MIKLKSIHIEAFRGIPGTLDVDLSAPITLIYAPNGVGKTSICDAAEWLLTNSIKRLEDSGAKPADFRCDFAAIKTATRVSGTIVTHDSEIEVERSLDDCRWRRDGNVFRRVSHSEFLETIAPSAAEPDVHKIHANHSRQIWLRGTRFLSGDSLAALLESDEESMGSREKLFADMLGVGHLIETERQLEIYLKNLNQYVRQQQALIDNGTTSLRRRLDGLDEETNRNEETLLPRALANVKEASRLLRFEDSLPEKEGVSVSDMRRLTALIRGELARKRDNWTGRRSAEVSLAADWQSRFVLIEQQSSDQRRSRDLTTLIEQVVADIATLFEQNNSMQPEWVEVDRALVANQALAGRLKSSLDKFRSFSSTHARFFSEQFYSYQSAVALDQVSPDEPALQASLQSAEITRTNLANVAREAEELRALRVMREEFRASAPSVKDKQNTLSALSNAEQEVETLKRDYERLAGPIGQLRHLSGSIIDMLSHAEECPVCAHDWGSSEALKQALIDARKMESPEVLKLSSALEASEAAVRQWQEKLAGMVSHEGRAKELDAQVGQLEEKQLAFADRLAAFGIKDDPNVSLALDAFCSRLLFVQAVRPVLAELSTSGGSSLDISLSVDEYASRFWDQLFQAIQKLRTHTEGLHAKIKAVQLELERRRRAKVGLEEEQLALNKKIENTEYRIQSLKAAWYLLGGERPWTNEALVEISNQLLQENSALLSTEELIDQAEHLIEASSNLGEIARLESELVPMQVERDRLTAYALAGEAAQKAYQDMRQQHVRRQMEEFVRVISALFIRMQSNEVYDRIEEGDASSPLSWRAISEGFAKDPDLRFSQGQRQDFALSIFLARARGLGGTFFLDEPLVHLDDLNRVALLDVFRAICLENNRDLSIVLTTASKPTLRHFVEKFSLTTKETQGGKSLLRVLHLNGSPRTGVSIEH
jgi:exonuclease SbcC